MYSTHLDWQHISNLDCSVDLSYALQILSGLHDHHFKNCPEYRHIISSLFLNLPSEFSSLDSLPYLPVSLFKSYDLMSSPYDEIIKCMNSSDQLTKLIN